MSYSGARRFFEKRIFSPTQSLKRLTSSSSGRTALAPAPPASRRNARRSIMTGESAAIPAGDHRAQRGRIYDEHQQHVDDEKSGKEPDRPKVPVPRHLKSAEQRGEPRELRGFVDRESGDDRQHTEEN